MKQIDSIILPLCLGAVAVATGTATAETINPFAPAEGFNIVVEHDFTLNGGHPEGAVAVGGNLTFQGGEISQRYTGSHLAPGATVGTGLIVGGSVDFAGSANQLLVGNQPANVYIGGGSYTVHDWNPNETVINNSSDPNSYPRIMTRADQTAASIGGPSGYDFGQAATSFRQSSLEMSQLAATMTGASLGLDHSMNLDGFGLDLGLNVINLTGAEYGNIQNINWNGAMLPGADRTVIFNIDVQGASSFELGKAAMGIGDETLSSYVLFNFYNLDGSLKLSGNQIIGSILAPDADITKFSDPKGQIFADNFVFQGGEVHFHENQVTYERTTSVPEGSSSWSVWVEACALLCILGWRRRLALAS